VVRCQRRRFRVKSSIPKGSWTGIPCWRAPDGTRSGWDTVWTPCCRPIARTCKICSSVAIWSSRRCIWDRLLLSISIESTVSAPPMRCCFPDPGNIYAFTDVRHQFIRLYASVRSCIFYFTVGLLYRMTKLWYAMGTFFIWVCWGDYMVRGGGLGVLM